MSFNYVCTRGKGGERERDRVHFFCNFSLFLHGIFVKLFLSWASDFLSGSAIHSIFFFPFHFISIFLIFFFSLCHCLFVHLFLFHYSLPLSIRPSLSLSFFGDLFEKSKRIVNELFFLYLAFDCWSLLSLSKEMEPIWFLEKKRSWDKKKKLLWINVR